MAIVILKGLALVGAFIATLALGIQVTRVITAARKMEQVSESLVPLAIAIFCWYIFFKL